MNTISFEEKLERMGFSGITVSTKEGKCILSGTVILPEGAAKCYFARAINFNSNGNNNDGVYVTRVSDGEGGFLWAPNNNVNYREMNGGDVVYPYLFHLQDRLHVIGIVDRGYENLFAVVPLKSLFTGVENEAAGSLVFSDKERMYIKEDLASEAGFECVYTEEERILKAKELRMEEEKARAERRNKICLRPRLYVYDEKGMEYSGTPVFPSEWPFLNDWEDAVEVDKKRNPISFFMVREIGQWKIRMHEIGISQ